ncbi:uncharacterized protein [Lepeophtheirus salmonis]|uniref:uncharacterized protein isoform X3 n=1 Tax=Lepeophtheirus salmonis TaxID=72036 RepID=UPI001AE7CF79|nr:RNA/RNP complex-1-interacting phosphatase-like isoform X3 [Lepeophtheirus salmonis]
MMNKIPERWEVYNNHGERIPGTPFIAFKTPLSERFFKNGWENYYYYEKGWADDAYYDKWTPAILEGTIPQLGSVIDLTATHKYYRPYELKYATHFKIKVPGRVIPPEDIVEKFFDIVDEVRESKPDKLIGVHCTHGVNRTGYFLCRYLIDKMDWSAEKAISECTINKPTCNLKDNKPPKYSADYPAKKKNKNKSKIIVGREATKVLELKKTKEHAETPKIKDLMGASLNLDLGGMDIVTKDDFRQIERALIRKINTFAGAQYYSCFIENFSRNLCADLSSTMLKKIKLTFIALLSERIKKENAEKIKKKNKNPTLNVYSIKDYRDTSINLEDYYIDEDST